MLHNTTLYERFFTLIDRFPVCYHFSKKMERSALYVIAQ